MKSFTLIIAFLLSSFLSIAQQNAIQSEVVGNGNPILFLPGFTNPGSIWKDTYEQLTTEHQAHFISYAGFNGITPIEMPWYTTIKTALVNYIKTNDLKNMVIIGHSMGGTLAADVAGEVPNRIDKIIFVDALPCMREVMMPGVPASNLQYESPYNDRMIAMDDHAFESTATMMSSGMTDNTEKLPLVKKWILEADRKTYVYGYTDLLKTDVRPQLSKIKAQSLVLVAPTYGIMAKENMEKQYADLNNKSVVLAPKGKHFIMFDNEAWFYEQVNAFLKSEH